MRVTLFRDLPTEHWYSMERYGDELERWLPQFGCDVESFVPARPLPSLRGIPNTLLNYTWRSIIYPGAAKSRQRDVNHIIDHSYAHLIKALDANKTIVTCHDIAPLALNEGRGIARRLWNESFRDMLRARHIIVDSEFTQNEILSHANYPKERIRVVPLGVSKEFFDPVSETDVRALRERYHLDSRRVILHVGSCEARKNIELILSALKDLASLDVVFVQIGGRFTKNQDAYIHSVGLRDRVLQVARTSEHNLAVWYRIASVFVFPSIYEGFGLPVIEAMASGAPVICANMGSLPEVVGNAALLIDPFDAIQFAKAVRAVLMDRSIAADMRARASVRAKMFSWRQCAQETSDVYCNLLKQLGG